MMVEANDLRPLHVRVCQLDIAWEDKSANFARVEDLLKTDPPAPGSLIVLPEMFATGFSMNAAALAEAPGGPTEQFLAGLASRTGCHVLAGLPARADASGGPTNDAVVFDTSGRLVDRYSKMRLFSFADEHRHYRPGEDVRVMEVGALKAAPLVCYDLRFPELARRAVARGAELLIYIANWPAVRQEHWLALLRARAIENQAFVVGANRCGDSPHNRYGGGSVIFDPQGQTLAQAGDAPAVIAADLDVRALLAYRQHFPALRDMGPSDAR